MINMRPTVAYYAVHKSAGHVLGIILGNESKNEYIVFGTHPKVVSLEEAKIELQKFVSNIYWHKEVL